VAIAFMSQLQDIDFAFYVNENSFVYEIYLKMYCMAYQSFCKKGF